jgi:hypothetical protein
MADGDQHVVQPAPLADVVMDLVGRHHAGAASLRHCGASFEHPGILGAEMVVQLAED